MSQPAFGQKQVMLLLVVVAVLLAAIVGVLVFQNMNSPAIPSAEGTVPPPTGAQPPAGMPGAGAQAPAVEFDPATAPAVPEGQTPSDYVTAYYEACAAKEYDTAFGLLPVASQQYYGDASAFAATLESYGVTEFRVDAPVENGDTVSVVGWQEAQGMSFGYEWTFVKADDGTMRVKARTMAGTQ